MSLTSWREGDRNRRHCSSSFPSGVWERQGGTLDRLSGGILDVFIPLAGVGKAGGRGGRVRFNPERSSVYVYKREGGNKFGRTGGIGGVC